MYKRESKEETFTPHNDFRLSAINFIRFSQIQPWTNEVELCVMKGCQGRLYLKYKHINILSP